MREREHWREQATVLLRVPFWKVDADVIVLSKLLPEKFAPSAIADKIRS